VEVDGCGEVRGVPEAARLALDAHDLAVQAFGDAVGDGMLHESEHAVEMTLERRRDVLDGLEPRADCPGVPPLEEACDGRLLAVRPERSQRFLDRPGPTDFQIQRLERGERLGVVLRASFVAEQPSCRSAASRRPPQELTMLLLADGIDRLRHLAHDVKAVEHDLLVAVRQAVTRRPDIRLPHVHRDRLQRRFLLSGQLLVVRGEAGGFAFFGHKFNRRALQVADDRVLPVALAKGLLVDADVRDRLRLRARIAI